MIDPNFYNLDSNSDFGGLPPQPEAGDDSVMLPLDENGDGIVEGYQILSDFDAYGNPTHVLNVIDTDGNGAADFYVEFSDENGDGMIETISKMHDYDQNGEVDKIEKFQDVNGDGQIEFRADTHIYAGEDGRIAYTDVRLDTTGDGKADVSMRQEIYDKDHDGVADTQVVTENPEGGDPTQGEATAYEYNPVDDLSGLQIANAGSYSDLAGSGAVATTNFDPSNSDNDSVSGNPAEDMEHWECQGPTKRCAVYSQLFVIEELTGQEVNIEELVQVATENGWFTENGGTTALNMAKLLDYYGVENEMHFDGSIEDIESALNKGEKVIVSLDADQIWYGKENDLFSPTNGSNHALEVIGIDRTDPEHPMVILNDSGTPDGCGEMVPLEKFEEAWGTGDHQMIVCRK